jgi:hypothetical protein
VASICIIYIEREIERKEGRKIDRKIEVEAYLGDLGRGGANQVLVLQLRPPGDTTDSSVELGQPRSGRQEATTQRASKKGQWKEGKG